MPASQLMLSCSASALRRHWVNASSLNWWPYDPCQQYDPLRSYSAAGKILVNSWLKSAFFVVSTRPSKAVRGLYGPYGEHAVNYRLQFV
jgi:hypothetical protein